MEVLSPVATAPKESFPREFQRFWHALPDKGLYAALLVGWISLFQFFGCSSPTVAHAGSLFEWMWRKWNDPFNDASHGKIIPFVVLALLWHKRRRLCDTVQQAWWPALLALTFALALHVVGFLVQQPRFSMVAFFAGTWILVGLTWGWETLKASFFPFVIFAFCVPVGGTFSQFLTLPLRVLATNVTAFICKDLLDIPLLIQGTQLSDPNGVFGDFDVAAACSGIRSFVALLAITTIFSVVALRTFWKRALMISLSVPLAVICNVLRLTTVILVAKAFGEREGFGVKAGLFVHEWFGYVTYALAIGCVLLAARWLREKPVPK